MQKGINNRGGDDGHGGLKGPSGDGEMDRYISDGCHVSDNKWNDPISNSYIVTWVILLWD